MKDKEKVTTQVHHSWGDWATRPGIEYRFATERFISSPTSLTVGNDDSTLVQYGQIFLDDALGKCIPHGVFITQYYLRSVSMSLPQFWFRTQELPEYAGVPIDRIVQPRNSYIVTLTYNRVQLIRRVNAASTVVGNINVLPNFVEKQWYRLRFDWETALPPDPAVLKFRFFIEYEGEWVEQGWLNDVQNKWETSPNNRLGFSISFLPYKPPWFWYVDNTEVWKRSA